MTADVRKVTASVRLYRLRTRLRRAHIPLVPALLGRLCIALDGTNIDDHVAIGDGLSIPHGMVVIGGFTRIGANATIGPRTAIGTRAGSFDGPAIGDGVTIGSDVTILGPWQIGDGATIADGSVVTRDVAAGSAVEGIPARPTARAPLRVVESC